MTNDLDQLDEKIRKARGEDVIQKGQPKNQDEENKRVGMHAGFEFVSSVIAGGVAGWFLDDWLGTKPLFFITLFMLGTGVGFYNVYRLTQNLGSAVGFSQLHKQKKDAKTSPEHENTDTNTDLDKK